MKRISKALFASFVALTPFLVREIVTSPGWRWLWVGVFVVAVFAFHFWQFGPDKRFERVKEPSLALLWEKLFREAQEKVGPLERLPLRANVMQKRHDWCGRSRLEIVYAYNMRATDPDFGISWQKGRGLCWEVFTKGVAGWYDKKVHSPDSMGLYPEEVEATRHVHAVLSLPVRKPVDQSSERWRYRRSPIAVLNIDALSEEAAQDLERARQNLVNRTESVLVDAVDLVSVYFK